MSLVLQEKFPCKIRQGEAHLTAQASGWHLRMRFDGPDGRYNPTYRDFQPGGLVFLSEACEQAWEKMRNIVSSGHGTTDGEITMNFDMDLSVHINNFGMNFVAIKNWHILFTDDDFTYKSFMNALEWCHIQGPKMVEKCVAIGE